MVYNKRTKSAEEKFGELPTIPSTVSPIQPTPDEWVTYVDADGVTQRIGIIYTPGVTWQEVIGPIIRDFFPQE